MCPSVFKYVQMCPSLSKCVQVCPSVSKCVQVCPSVPKCAKICPSVSKCAQVCPSVFKCVQVCIFYTAVLLWRHGRAQSVRNDRKVWKWLNATFLDTSFKHKMTEKMTFSIRNVAYFYKNQFFGAQSSYGMVYSIGKIWKIKVLEMVENFTFEPYLLTHSAGSNKWFVIPFFTPESSPID